MCNMSGGVGSGGHDRSTALPLHLSQRVNLTVFTKRNTPSGLCVCDCKSSLSFRCIDEWFEVNRSCPEHPSD